MLVLLEDLEIKEINFNMYKNIKVTDGLIEELANNDNVWVCGGVGSLKGSKILTDRATGVAYVFSQENYKKYLEEVYYPF